MKIQKKFTLELFAEFNPRKFKQLTRPHRIAPWIFRLNTSFRKNLRADPGRAGLDHAPVDGTKKKAVGAGATGNQEVSPEVQTGRRRRTVFLI
jgi:hypothetical protein